MQRRRISETERRVLDAAVALVEERGISTGLEGIVFDEVVRRAGVSRTSAYRRWPRRDQFNGEVLRELARGASLPAPEAAIIGPSAEVVRGYARRLESPREHRDLVVELLRVSIGRDYEVASTAPGWRAFTSLLASHRGIVDDEVREAVAAELVATERRWVQARARAYAQFTALLGYRLIPLLAGPDGFELMSRAAGATMTGLLAKLSLGDGDSPASWRLRALGSTQVAEWTPAVYMIAATVLSYVEPDPGVVWDATRADDLLAAIASHFSRQLQA